MLQLFKLFAVSIGCAMFALIVHNVCEEKKCAGINSLVSRLRKSGL